MTRSSAPAFQFYGRDFEASTATWSCEEVGAYLRLLIAQWELGERGLPDDLSRLQTTVRANGSEAFLEAWESLLEAKFPVGDDGRRRNPRLFEIWERTEAMRAAGSKAGKASAEARRQRSANDPPTDKERSRQRSPNDSSTLRSPVSGLQSPDSKLHKRESPSETTKEDENEALSPRTIAEGPLLFRFRTRKTERQKATSWELRGNKVDEWIEAFPGLDVGPEIRSAWQWLKDNPDKMKTASGMTSYLGGWLRRADKQRRKDLAERSHPGGLPQPTYHEVSKEASDKAARAKSAEHPQGCDCALCRYVLTLKKDGDDE